ncbi:hypothetical protein CONLIGDRAFT_241244 [Coniochaeta ligniaria NRRL 30616]|uniref:Uncharacterized protein n=1 Tax=Coniochaeta ligniaria NRRL 30616 TaxID=1408157 RepID=A0A1J7JR13_9PEZI|nr:hypothetical protein CONLIGDRAFT_241244 [Coniochaeta ligniaria NRRL 30616]
MARQPKPPSTSTPSDLASVVPTSATVSASTAAAAAASPSSLSADAQIKQRVPHSRRSGRVAQSKEETQGMPNEDIPMAERPVVDGGSDDAVPVLSHGSAAKNKWIIFALASGACAAFNGVFAKLATGELTSSISRGVAHFLHLSAAEGVIEVIVRCVFFGLNLAFNGIVSTLSLTSLGSRISSDSAPRFPIWLAVCLCYPYPGMASYVLFLKADGSSRAAPGPFILSSQ